MQRVRGGDQVQILAGRDRGKRGKVLHVFPREERLTVEGLNVVKRHLRRSQLNPQGGILSREAPLPMDRVQPICPRCNRPVRVSFRRLTDGSKVRACRRCGEGF